jgi:hypothetical protein
MKFFLPPLLSALAAAVPCPAFCQTVSLARSAPLLSPAAFQAAGIRPSARANLSLPAPIRLAPRIASEAPKRKTAASILRSRVQAIRKAMKSASLTRASAEIGLLFGEGPGLEYRPVQNGFPEPLVHFSAARAVAVKKAPDAALAQARFNFAETNGVWTYVFHSSAKKKLIQVGVDPAGNIVEATVSKVPEDYSTGVVQLENLIPLKVAIEAVRRKRGVEPVGVAIFRNNPLWGPPGQLKGVVYLFQLPNDDYLTLSAEAVPFMDGEEKIEPRLRDELEALGPGMATDVILVLDVPEGPNGYAKASKPVLKFLKAAGVEYTELKTLGMIIARLDKEQAEALAAMPQVQSLSANGEVRAI